MQTASKAWMLKVGLTANQGGTAGLPRPCPGDGVFVFLEVYLCTLLPELGQWVEVYS